MHFESDRFSEVQFVVRFHSSWCESSKFEQEDLISSKLSNGMLFVAAL